MCNLLTSKLFNLNLYPLEVVSRSRDPQRQVSEKYSDLTNGGQRFLNHADWCHVLSFMLISWYLMYWWKMEKKHKFNRHWRSKGSWLNHIYHFPVVAPDPSNRSSDRSSDYGHISSPCVAIGRTPNIANHVFRHLKNIYWLKLFFLLLFNSLTCPAMSR